MSTHFAGRNISGDFSLGRGPGPRGGGGGRGGGGRRTLSSASRPLFHLGDAFAGQSATRSQVTQLGAQATQLEGLRGQVTRSVDNAPAREGRGIRNAASLGVQQQLGDQASGAVTHGSVLSNALRRAKARVGIAGRGDDAIRNQQLKNRLTQVRADVGSQARALQTQVTGINIKAGVNAGVGNAVSAGQAFRANAIGGVLGGAVGVLKANVQDRGGAFNFFGKKPVFSEQPLGGG